ncbi:FtsX-like permease family protein [Chitinophaga lutea]|uniref:FtsX-like permease family protein n=1 Tax=Chitinophaga lutea TaxID=2488634 RepID=A0A3N4QCW8_9BACT|nr:ABC transporter permease [Chitinophaga lutea]RPE13820.1 FtsX-like permease family protein [Chitinophaga lutea]
MLRNYFKVALRHLLRNKGITFINVAGLAIGMACCILIVLFIRHELGYNNFHARGKEIYRLVYDMKHSDGLVEYGTSTQFAAAPALKRELAGIKESVRVFNAREVVIAAAGEAYRQQNVLFVDQDFFNVFSFPLTAGNPATALKDPYSVVLTESTAKKYFGTVNPVGKALRVQDDYDCIVTGVVKDVPSNSDIDFDILFSFKTILQNAAKTGSNPESSWYAFSNNQTFVTLTPGTTPNSIRGELNGLVERYITPIAKTLGEQFSYQLQPLANMHLKPEGDLAPDEASTKLYLYGVIGLFIILIGCINFMNLVTARGHERAMEVGLRKVMGAERKALIVQFLVESVVICILAFMLAVLLAQLLLPGFNYVTDKTLTIFEPGNVPLLSLLLLLAVVVGLMAGSYPALYLSGFIPVRILKGGAKSAGGRSLFRKVLVVSQFSIAIALIIATVVIYSQLRYMQRKDLGFNKAGLVNFNLNNPKQAGLRPAFKAELERLPFVQSAAYTSMPPGVGFTSVNPVGLEGSKSEDSKLSVIVNADFSYFTNMGVKIAAGRDFDARFPTDSIDAFVINKKAAAILGLKNPVGSRIEWRGGPVPRKGTVIGVVEDFNMQSLRLPIEPMVAMIRPAQARMLMVRLAPGDKQQQVARIGEIWQRMMPAFPFNYRFVESEIGNEYEQEKRTGSLFGAYACLAVFIASMGLFGLAMLVARQRTKEIGIRKVLGASVSSIMTLLSKDFLQLVFIAIFIAAPIAWYAASRWLENFAFPISMPWWAFIAAGGGALLIAFVTISFQAIKAALLNPVRSLRSE